MRTHATKTHKTASHLFFVIYHMNNVLPLNLYRLISPPTVINALFLLDFFGESLKKKDQKNSQASFSPKPRKYTPTPCLQLHQQNGKQYAKRKRKDIYVEKTTRN